MKQSSNLKEFMYYTIMNVIGMTGLSCYILADTFFVSKGLGANGLTALNLAIPVYSFVHGSGLMIGMGGATKYAIFKGQQSRKNAERVFTNAVFTGAVMMAVFFLVGMFFSGQIASLLGADQTVFAMTRTYLKVILLFAPAFILNDIMICFVRNDGNPKLSMIAMLTGSFSNIILDYLFIFPMKMGILGAVLATGLAPVISLCILSVHFMKKQNQFYFIKTPVSLDLVKATVQIGFPSLITEVASGLVMIVFNMIILNIQGNVGVAAYGVIANLSLVVTAIYTGIAQGMQPLTSRAYGHGDTKTIRQIFRYGVLTMLVISIVIYGFTFGMAEPIVEIFNSGHNGKMHEIATTGLKLYFIAIPFMGFNIVSAMLFSSTEKAVSAQVVSLSRGIAISIPMAFLLSQAAGLYGVWMTIPITEGIVAILAVAFYGRGFGRRSHTGKQSQSIL